jgi:TRAP-type C4-dicarboxylate transport system permease small subunit
MLRRLADTVRAADRAWAAFERALIAALLALMAGAVFLDAMHRVFAAGEGRLERLLVAVTPEGAHAAVRAVVAPAVLLLATWAVAYGALKTRAPEPRRRNLLVAAALTGGLAGATRLLVVALPNGLVWSQPLALALLLWVALAGASLGARERAHVAFELAGRLWPRRMRGAAELVARLAAAAFSIFLAVLAAAHAREHYLEWASSDGAAGLFEGFGAPRWTIFAFLPLPLAVMALRFLAYGVRAPEGEEEAAA